MATLPGIIDRLEQAGFIERQVDPEDQCAVRICLIPRAFQAVGDGEAIIEEANREFTRCLKAEERKLGIKILERLKQH